MKQWSGLLATQMKWYAELKLSVTVVLITPPVITLVQQHALRELHVGTQTSLDICIDKISQFWQSLLLDASVRASMSSASC
jgi:hypothetical protein